MTIAIQEGATPEALHERIMENSKEFFIGNEGRVKQLFAERVMNFIIEAHNELSNVTSNLTPFCKAGCSYCCCQTFQIGYAESVAIAYYLLQHPELLLPFLGSALEREKKITPYRELLTQVQDGSMSVTAAAEFYKLKIPCEFLNDHLCEIYPVRPLICDAYISMAPPKICALEGRGTMPPKVEGIYAGKKYWLQIQEKSRYKAIQFDYMTPLVLSHLLTGDF